MPKYTIGLDFGTLSGRALLVDISDGREVATAVMDYPHAVMDENLPSGKSLPPDYALQHPQDYLDVISYIIPQVIKAAGVSPDDIIGIGLDFTACTLIPVKADGTPLCFIDKYRDEPHAYIKLWKHHAAQSQANRLNKIAEERNEAFLPRYGGKISSEWLIPKIWQVLEEAPEIYDDADYFIEATDWIIWQLTGKQTRNSCTAGYKAVWNKKEGYPSKEFFAALDPRLEDLTDTKLDCHISPIGSKAGEITKEASELTGLKEGTAVAVGNVDAHVCAPSVKVTGENRMFAIVGTSACHMVMSKKEVSVPGICGYVEDGILPGFFGYEAGQSCCGDHFAWFTENCVPESYEKEAREKGIDIHRLLTEKAAKLRPGESGLIALDWWNGNRSVLVDVDLCGLMIGMTLHTKPEEIYRALIEAVAFGTKKIVENFKENGIEIDEFIAAGGIADKNPLMMQIYADVIGMPVKIAGTSQGPALGSAIFGAIAAGSVKGGYDDVFTAAQRMGNLKDKVYLPDAAGSAVYAELYTEYERLHDYFGRGENNVMKRLKNMTKRVKGEKNV